MTNRNFTATIKTINLKTGSLKTENRFGADLTISLSDVTDEQLADLMNMVEMPLSLRLEALGAAQAPEPMPSHQPAQPKAAKAKFHRTAATRMH
jgi:hypothetical protein